MNRYRWSRSNPLPMVPVCFVTEVPGLDPSDAERSASLAPAGSAVALEEVEQLVTQNARLRALTRARRRSKRGASRPEEPRQRESDELEGRATKRETEGAEVPATSRTSRHGPARALVSVEVALKSVLIATTPTSSSSMSSVTSTADESPCR